MEKKNKQENVNNQKSETTHIIEIVRHRQLYELLCDPKRTWRATLMLIITLVFLFICLTCVTLIIKSFYPYNKINTNAYGATFIKGEDKEVIYWLYNTADLWANSGIKVKKGDVLKIRASGASYSAIHHLIKEAQDNIKSKNNWIEASGQKSNDPRDVLWSEYRLNKTSDMGCLLMCVVEEGEEHKDSEWLKDNGKGVRYLQAGDGVEFIDIGKERTITIRKDGILHFAVNDVALSDNVMLDMYCNYLDSAKAKNVIKEDKNKIDSIKMEAKQFFLNSQDSVSTKNFVSIIKSTGYENPDTTIDNLKSLINGLQLSCPMLDNDTINYIKYYPYLNELVYYKDKSYRNAWFVDNLGSFLIVIEKQ